MIQEKRCHCHWKLTVAGYEHTCNRLAETGDYCILHDPSPDKDEAIFLKEIQSIIDTNEKHNDFRGVQFFTTGGLLRRSYNRIAIFDGAIFHCNADFMRAQFDVSYSFLGTTFVRDADFSGRCRLRNGSFTDAIFKGSCSFADASFHERSDLINVTFNTKTSFENADFTNSGLVMRFVKFLGSTSFKGCKLDKEIAKFKFDNCNLHGLLLSNWAMFPDNTIFENVSWSRKTYLWLFRGRLMLADESFSKGKKSILRCYEQLHRYYFDYSEYDIASEFYVSSMVMRRKVEKLRRGMKLFDLTYSILSRYGESVGRPFWALIVMWLLVPVILLLLGTQLEIDGNTVVYSMKSDGTFFLFTNDYWKTFQLSFSQSTLFRGGDLKPSLTSIQHTVLLFETLFNALLVSFLALGIRRKFAPKKPD